MVLHSFVFVLLWEHTLGGREFWVVVPGKSARCPGVLRFCLEARQSGAEINWGLCFLFFGMCLGNLPDCAKSVPYTSLCTVNICKKFEMFH